ncbi:MAG: MBL fold metallo-hydrolase [Candidatus Buchananbacteria bacterium]
MKITFFGAAQNVTGSKHLLESGDCRLLLDCGMYQGKRQEAYDLNQSLPFSSEQVNAVILSHAHADHCGLLPLLVKNGYNHKIFATSATVDVARLIMLDSAKIQQSDYQHLTELGPANKKVLLPLYTAEDVEKTCAQFEILPYAKQTKEWHQFNQFCRFKLYEAGHILGSAVTVVQVTESGVVKNLAYTGDLGNTNVPLLPEPEQIVEPIETLISECTYGDKNHQPLAEVAGRLKEIIRDAVKHQRKIIVPAFALGRTQELIYILHKLYHQGEIPIIPIYLDSPLASSITEVFSKHSEDFDQATWTDFLSQHESPFAFQNLHYVQTNEESKALANSHGPFMVIASSGMAEGGRILHHLECSIGDPEAVILITGYQAEQTLGRKIQEGLTPVRIYDRLHVVRAKILTFNEFSAHADQTGLLSYISALKGLQRVFLVHTELPQAAVFKNLLKQRFPKLEVIIPARGESFEI